MGATVSLGSSAAGDYLAGRFAQNRYDLPVAAEYLQRALAEDPENVELLQRTYLALAADGRLKDAAATAKRLLDFDPEAAIAAILVAEQQARAGSWSSVEASVAGLPKRGLNNLITPLIIAWARVGQGRTDAALEALVPLSQTTNYAALHNFHAGLINDLADRWKAATGLP
jgi:tetratricopeptide (TPR) repeat protein